MDTESVYRRLETELAAAATPKARLEAAAGELSAFFGVSRDEVAIFSFDTLREMLVFVWPPSLKTVGSIPLNAHHCLVSKTATERRGSLDNSFMTTPHLYMFEHFLADKGQRIPIQKIMSVPMGENGHLAGVVQVARKGHERDAAGPDFTGDDLAALTCMARLIGGYL
jgi:hypothetical protein